MCPQLAPVIAPIFKSTVGKAILGAVATTAVSKLMGGNKRPQQPTPIVPKQNVPYQRPTAPQAASALDTENIRPEDEDIKLTQSKKARKKLERTRRGVKDLAAVDAPTDTPSMGLNPAGYGS